MDNPLLAREGLPPFDRVAPAHVVPAVRQVLAEAERELEAIERDPPPTWEGLMEPLERLDIPFEYAWAPVTHLLGVRNSDELREAHAAVLPEVVAFGLRVSQSRPVHDGLRALRDGPSWAALDVHRRIAARVNPMPPLADDRFLCAFAHIFGGGYAAGYYSYKFSEVMSADCFAAFEEAGLDEPAALAGAGRRYRDTFLALGGSRPPLEVFEAFRGRPPQVAPLLRHNGLASPPTGP